MNKIKKNIFDKIILNDLKTVILIMNFILKTSTYF